MLALKLHFVAGRYHATPWGRHVNEGEVSWPPDPWRLARALIAAWHHKIKPLGQHEQSTLEGLITALASELPAYHLPPASHNHTRHYLPQSKAGSTALVFDAFAAVNRDTPLYIYWSELELSETQTRLLDSLLEVLGYLGRAESWVEARRVQDIQPINCSPGEQAIDTQTGELLGEVVSVLAPVSANEYAHRRASFVADKKKAKRLRNTLPESLLDALSLDTADLQKSGWSQPPAAQQTHYIRPIDALRPQLTLHTPSLPDARFARFLLIGKPLPRVEDSLRIGELIRMAVMHAFGKDEQGNELAPPAFSGHDLPKENRHQHAFYLPFDSRSDGRLDRVLIHVPCGFDAEQGRTLNRLHELWQPGGGRWRLLFEGWGGIEQAGQLAENNASRQWISVTPYLHPWHRKKGFTIEDQLRRECAVRDLPEPVRIKRIPEISVGKQRRRAVHFQRFRHRRNQPQPDRHGGFWHLEFAQPITGPLALGSNCHFGLGLFKPIRGEEAGNEP